LTSTPPPEGVRYVDFGQWQLNGFASAVRLLEARRALCRALELVVLGDMAALGQTTGSVSLRHGVEHSAG